MKLVMQLMENGIVRAIVFPFRIAGIIIAMSIMVAWYTFFKERR